MDAIKRLSDSGQAEPSERDTRRKPVGMFFRELATRYKKFWFGLKTRLAAFGKKRAQQRSKALPMQPEFGAALEPIVEKLTDDLIAETVGPDGVLTKEFQRRISNYNSAENPIGPKEAEAMMLSLLELAVSRRKLLNERLEKSVEVGALYESYYGRVQAINQLAAKAHSAMERMDFAEEDYRYYYDLLLNVRSRSVVAELVPSEMSQERLEAIRDRMNRRERDIMLELDKMGGG